MTTPNPYAHRTAQHFDGIRYDEALIQKNTIAKVHAIPPTQQP